MARNVTRFATRGKLPPRRTLRSFAEHSMVTLSSQLRLDDGRVLPPGARGAVVGIWAEGESYEVEFIEPFHAVVTVSAPKLRRAGSAP